RRVRADRRGRRAPLGGAVGREQAPQLRPRRPAARRTGMTVVLLRHASAGDRDKWDGDDRRRPLDKRGRRQSKKLRDALLALGVTRVLSSPYLRCVQTVAPLGLDIELDERLAEGAARTEFLALLADADGAVACTHGDVIENVIGRSIKKGAAVVLEESVVVDELAAPQRGPEPAPFSWLALAPPQRRPRRR